MGKQKEQRKIIKRRRVYTYLTGSWQQHGSDSYLDASYPSEFGWVSIRGYRSPDHEYIDYSLILNGVEYEMHDPVARTRHGIMSVASRFARDVVNGRYDV